MKQCNLKDKSCKPCEGGVEPMDENAVVAQLEVIPGWDFCEGRLRKEFLFKNHYQAVAFLNAVAWISHSENHHPLITLGFKDVLIDYWTHAIDGISENDFICAAKVNELIES